MTSKKFNGRNEQLAIICGIDTEKGINCEAMNEEKNFVSYCYLLICDEKDKNESRVKSIDELLEEYPTDKNCDKKQLNEKQALKLEKQTLQERHEELMQGLDLYKVDGKVVAPEVTTLSATWAFSKGTKEYGNLLIVPNRANIMKSVEEIAKALKGHLDLLESFMDSKEARHGEVYTGLKAELCNLFSLLNDKDITANKTDVIAVLHKCVIVKGGVKADNNAQETSVSVRKDKSILKACCDVLTAKRVKRENPEAK